MKNYFNILCIVLLVALVFNAQAQLSETLGETLINTTTARTQQNPEVAINTVGKYVVAWESLNQDGDDYGIYARAFKTDNTEEVAEFRINTSTTNSQRFPSVAMDDSDIFMVVWQSLGQDGDGWGIYFQMYDMSSGSAVVVGTETLVNTTTAGQQRFPQVATSSAGDFIVTWESAGDIHAQRYANTGASVGSEFVVNTTTTNVQTYPSVDTRYNDGSFVIAWQSLNQDGDGYGIYAQRYANTGASVGSEFVVNTTTTEHQIEPSVGVDASGNFLISWSSFDQDGDAYGIYARFYDNTGIAITGEIQINETTTASQKHSSVTGIDNNLYVVSWTSDDQDGDKVGVYTRILNNSTSNREERVNDNTMDYQQFARVASVVNNVIMVWQDGLHEQVSSNEGDDYGVYTKRYTGSNTSLPITLLRFEAERQGESEQVLLTWTTASEKDNKGFEIEQSTDGINFSQIGFVDGTGNSNEIINYQFSIINSKSAYYRLKQIDFDNNFAYIVLLNIM